QCNGCDKPTHALEVDDVLSLALKGEHAKAIAVKDPRKLHLATQDNYLKRLVSSHAGAAGHDTPHHHEAPADYLYKTMAETVSSASYIFNQSKLSRKAEEYPSTEIGQGLKTIATLICSDINTKAYDLSL